LVVNERQEVLRGRGVALLDGGQDTRDLAHAVKHNRRRDDRPASGGARPREVTECQARSIHHVAGCPYRFLRLTLSRSTTRFHPALQEPPHRLSFTHKSLILHWPFQIPI